VFSDRLVFVSVCFSSRPICLSNFEPAANGLFIELAIRARTAKFFQFGLQLSCLLPLESQLLIPTLFHVGH